MFSSWPHVFATGAQELGAALPSFLSVAMLLAQNTQVSMPIHRLATVYTSKITSCGTVQSHANGDGECEGRVQGCQRQRATIPWRRCQPRAGGPTTTAGAA